MLSQANTFLTGLPSRISIRITPRTRLFAISFAAISISLWTLLRLLRRQMEEETEEKEEKMEQNFVTRPSQTQFQASFRRKAGSDFPVSRRMRNSPSLCSNSMDFRHSNIETSVIMGLENLSEITKCWEKAMQAGDLKQNRPILPSEDGVYKDLETIIEKARNIQNDLKKMVEQYGLESTLGAIDNASTASGAGYYSLVDYPTAAQCSLAGRRGTMSVLSDDSFASALEDLVPIFADMDILLRDPLNLNMSELLYFHEGVQAVHTGNIMCRNLRTDFVQCETDTEFLAKLYCIRNAFQLILSESGKRGWMKQTGRSLIADIMQQTQKDASKYTAAYDRMMEFLNEEQVCERIAEELKSRKVPEVTFYDVVLDFILMDAFDDLASPPSAVLAVAQNRFLSSSFKESTLSTVVWSVLKAKRGRLQVADGFLAHFYDISEHVSPILAWGFLGTDPILRDKCYYFKDQICSFLTDIFSFERVRYTAKEDLAEDIWQFCKKRVDMTLTRISNDNLSYEE